MPLKTHIYKKLIDISWETKNFSKKNKENEKLWLDLLKECYDSAANCDGKHKLHRPSDILPELYVNGLDNEQVWQQIELLNNSLENDASFGELHCNQFSKDTSLLARVELLNDLASNDPSLGLLKNLPQKEVNDDDIDEELLDDKSGEDKNDDDSDGEIVDDETELMDEEHQPESGYEEPESDNEFDDSDIEDEEDENVKITDNIKKTYFDSINDDDTDSDIDFDKCFAKADDDIEDFSDENETGNKSNEEDDEETQNKSVDIPKSFGRTEIDTDFLKIRESEWIADNDAIGDDCGDFSDIDFMADEDDDDEEEEEANIMYKDFFDEPTNFKKYRPTSKKFLQGDVEREEGMEDKKSIEDNDKEEDDDKEKDPLSQPLEEDNKAMGTKSSFEREQEKERKKIAALENANVDKKDWVLKGEVHSCDRPEESLLQEALEYNITSSLKPLTSGDVTSKLEKFIIGVIRSGGWDDVERKAKPSNDPYEYKKKLLLDQERSKKSLADIYEQEYIKQQQSKTNTEEEELAEHKEIQSEMDDLFSKLDALANYHFTPRLKSAEIKVVSNLPAITVEETTPATVSDATLLAPQEVLASERGELRGKTERSTTDKKRDRRVKKSQQKKKSKEEEIIMQQKLKKLGKDGTPNGLGKNTSVKLVEKALKMGHVKLLENSGKVEKSLTSLDGGEFNKKRKGPNHEQKNTKKMKNNINTATKLLL